MYQHTVSVLIKWLNVCIFIVESRTTVRILIDLNVFVFIYTTKEMTASYRVNTHKTISSIQIDGRQPSPPRPACLDSQWGFLPGLDTLKTQNWDNSITPTPSSLLKCLVIWKVEVLTVRKLKLTFTRLQKYFNPLRSQDD